LTVVWDGAPIHRSRLVKDYVEETGGRVLLERFPANAPVLNPVEYMWGNLKQHQIGNLIATQAWELSLAATAALRRMRWGWREPALLKSTMKIHQAMNSAGILQWSCRPN
jgi:hypothetical protein